MLVFLAAVNHPMTGRVQTVPPGASYRLRPGSIYHERRDCPALAHTRIFETDRDHLPGRMRACKRCAPA